MKCFSAESADLDSAHVSKGTCVIRPCFTNLWLKLKSSDGEKERGGCIVFFCFACSNVYTPSQKLKTIQGYEPNEVLTNF